MILENCTAQIKDRDLRQMTEYFLIKYEEIITTMTPSLTGLYHGAELTCKDHIERTFWFATQISLEMGLSKEETSILQTAALLHDISNYELTYKEDKPQQATVQYVTGWHRSLDAYTYHGPIGGFIIGQYMLEKRTERAMEKFVKVAMAVSSHMSHWHQTCPQPRTDLEKYLALADYFASRAEIQINQPQKS